MATRMNWTWIHRIRTKVFTTFLHEGYYRINVMIGEGDTPPNSEPEFSILRYNCKSHEAAAELGFKHAKHQLADPKYDEHRVITEKVQAGLDKLEKL